MNFECQKANLGNPGIRQKVTLSICERVIDGYDQLDRFIEILEKHRKLVRDGNPAGQEGLTLNITL